MTGVAVFLAARLDEDEAAAKAATPGPWRWNDPTCAGQEWGHEGPDLLGLDDREVAKSFGYDADGLEISDDDQAHIARWDPARVLREVAAKRKIVAEHRIVTGEDEDYDLYRLPAGKGFGCATCHYYAQGSVKDYGLCRTLRHLLSVYSDHPDYDQEWKP